MNVGIVGAGAIGGFLLKELKDDASFRVVAVAEIDIPKGKRVLGELGLSEELLVPLEEFPSETEVFIEAASAAVAETVARFALERGKTAVIASVGGIENLDKLAELATEKGGRLLLPSGAVAGLDALKAIPADSISRVILTTSKPARTLADDPYLKDKGINTLDFEEPTVVFHGSAREAARAFPKSANVAATVGLASLGLDRVEVQVWADPDSDRNRHNIRLESEHGIMVSAVGNVPFEINPRTSRLAAYSILAAVRGLVKPVVIGT